MIDDQPASVHRVTHSVFNQSAIPELLQVRLVPNQPTASKHWRQVNFYRIIIFKGSCPDCQCLSNLNSIALTVSELLTFNTQKFRGSCDPGHAPFQKILRCHVQTVAGNIRVKFEVCSFNCFKLVWLTGPLRTDAYTDTSNENSISAIHSVHLAEIINKTVNSGNDWADKSIVTAVLAVCSSITLETSSWWTIWRILDAKVHRSKPSPTSVCN